MNNMFNFPTPNYFRITNLSTVIVALMRTAFLISGIVVFVFLIWGGVGWITSGGDANKAQQARDKITYALVGLAIIALSYAVAILLSNWLGIPFLNFIIPVAYS